MSDHGKEKGRAIFQTLPRRSRLKITGELKPPPMMHRVEFKVSAFRCVGRMFIWLKALFGYLGKVHVDKLRRRDSVQNRAIHVREAFESIGGTFIKLGQQLALRVDLIPFVYCQELGKMLDRGVSIPVDTAIAAIERVTCGPLEKTFASFDPDAIGAASIACVYQAVLHTGERVAVKVRRPGIETRFAADLTALGWVMQLLEWMTVFRAGFTKHLRAEIKTMLMEELDFVQEARYQELFRRNAKRHRQTGITAPKVFPRLCGYDVIVQEFVEGIWAGELLEAVERDDQDTLRRLADMGITPKRVAKRLMKALHWSTQENTFFHSDPHPANLVLQEGGRLVFIDFGACGPTTQRSRRLQAEVYHRLAKDDIQGATRAAVSMIEPLPNIDFEEFLKRAEAAWWHKLYALRSHHSPWWDHTTASIWMALLEVTQEYQVPINLDTLRAIRASLLYDTLAARLWNNIDESTFIDYERSAKKRMARKFRRRVNRLRARDILATAESAVELGNRLEARLEDFVDIRPTRFYALASKASYAVSTILEYLGHSFMVAIIITIWIATYRYASHLPVIGDPSIFRVVLTHPAFLAYLGIRAVLILRRVNFRLSDLNIGD